MDYNILAQYFEKYYSKNASFIKKETTKHKRRVRLYAFLIFFGFMFLSFGFGLSATWIYHDDKIETIMFVFAIGIMIFAFIKYPKGRYTYSKLVQEYVFKEVLKEVNWGLCTDNISIAEVAVGFPDIRTRKRPYIYSVNGFYKDNTTKYFFGVNVTSEGSGDDADVTEHYFAHSQIRIDRLNPQIISDIKYSKIKTKPNSIFSGIGNFINTKIFKFKDEAGDFFTPDEMAALEMICDEAEDRMNSINISIKNQMLYVTFPSCESMMFEQGKEYKSLRSFCNYIIVTERIFDCVTNKIV